MKRKGYKKTAPFHPFSSFFILFHPFSSKKAEKGRKRQKKAEKGRDRLGWIRGIQGIEGIPLEVPYAKKCKQKNINQHSAIFICLLLFYYVKQHKSMIRSFGSNMYSILWIQSMIRSFGSNIYSILWIQSMKRFQEIIIAVVLLFCCLLFYFVKQKE